MIATRPLVAEPCALVLQRQHPIDRQAARLRGDEVARHDAEPFDGDPVAGLMFHDDLQAVIGHPTAAMEMSLRRRD